jgi:hypothetical protein
MIRRRKVRNKFEVTFALDDDAPVSVVGDFNRWDPHAHPLLPDPSGQRSVTVTLPPGSYAFRYLADGGRFFNDSDADSYVDNDRGDTHGVLDIEAPPATPKKVSDPPPSKKPRARAAKKRPTSS